MLRENIQNAYDAILLREFRNPKSFEPLISVTIRDREVRVEDNGVGMTSTEVENNFWRAGASGKNTAEARSAGVVGTFGIGALANFGICQKLSVETESIADGSRTTSGAERDSLSLDEECITLQKLPATGTPGTTITAELDSKTSIQINDAIAYLMPFVRHLKVPVKINGILVSTKPLEESCLSDPYRWSLLAKGLIAHPWKCDVEIRISENGIVWASVTNLIFNGTAIEGQAILKQGVGQVMAYRSAFGLARAAASSYYSFGGVADLKILQPTAGRDALTIQSIQTIQSLVSGIEDMIAPLIADTQYSDLNTSFMTWVVRHSRYDLCGNLMVTVMPRDQQMTLHDVSALSKKVHMNSYGGFDATIPRVYASDDSPLVVTSHSNPRAQCEEGYLNRYGKVTKVSDEPQILAVRPDTSWTKPEAALAFRLATTLETDYFVSVRIKYGEISHNLPVILKEDPRSTVLTLSTKNPSISVLLQCYDSDYFAFGPLVKDFVRTVIFPRVSHLVPSSTRQGAEGFLKMLRRQSEIFEYDLNDMRRMEEVVAGFSKGNVSFTEVVSRALATARKQQQEVSVQDMQSVTSVIPDVLEYQEVLQNEETRPSADPYSPFSAKPAISRPDVETDAKLLVLGESQVRYGFSGLLRLSERAYTDKGEFFLQPHSTEVIWGGQRVIFIFRHLSGKFGFYYDVLLNELLSIPSGGGNFETLTLLLKNSVFVPIPSNLYQYFTPAENEKKRFDVRYDILYPE